MREINTYTHPAVLSQTEIDSVARDLHCLVTDGWEVISAVPVKEQASVYINGQNYDTQVDKILIYLERIIEC